MLLKNKTEHLRATSVPSLAVPLKCCSAATTAQEKSCVFNRSPTHNTHKWQKVILLSSSAGFGLSSSEGAAAFGCLWDHVAF